MIRILRSESCDECLSWRATSDGYGFDDGWPVLRTDGFRPDTISTSVDVLGRYRHQYMDVQPCMLVQKSYGKTYDLVSCGTKRDQLIMLTTDRFDIGKDNAKIIAEGADIPLFSFTARTRSSGWRDRWGRSVILFDDPDSYVLVKIQPKTQTSPFGYAISWKYGHLHIGGVERLEEFEKDPMAYFEKKVPEEERFDAAFARYRERKRLRDRFRRIVAEYTFASLPIDGIFTFGPDAVSVFFGGKKINFYYHKDSLKPFRKCVEQIDDIYHISFEPVWYNGGNLCAQTISGSKYCRLSSD
ncbi:hypothetical protein IJV57_02380 [Candidatus Saccharibacteria bacterium]|nr:hypothetical protein [Candidatus Saccharibacteria bacterium]